MNEENFTDPSVKTEESPLTKTSVQNAIKEFREQNLKDLDILFWKLSLDTGLQKIQAYIGSFQASNAESVCAEFEMQVQGLVQNMRNSFSQAKSKGENPGLKQVFGDEVSLLEILITPYEEEVSSWGDALTESQKERVPQMLSQIKGSLQEVMSKAVHTRLILLGKTQAPVRK